MLCRSLRDSSTHYSIIRLSFSIPVYQGCLYVPKGGKVGLFLTRSSFLLGVLFDHIVPPILNARFTGKQLLRFWEKWPQHKTFTNRKNYHSKFFAYWVVTPFCFILLLRPDQICKSEFSEPFVFPVKRAWEEPPWGVKLSALATVLWKRIANGSERFFA